MGSVTLSVHGIPTIPESPLEYASEGSSSATVQSSRASDTQSSTSTAGASEPSLVAQVAKSAALVRDEVITTCHCHVCVCLSSHAMFVFFAKQFALVFACITWAHGALGTRMGRLSCMEPRVFVLAFACTCAHGPPYVVRTDPALC